MYHKPAKLYNMSKIAILSDELISQISAGEVIERPASAVKELVENSVDAGASRIVVEIEEGGLKKIRVLDDGVGISESDARLAFERHATSKLSVLDDLFNIRSLGFRGEALASIASVSRVVMKTKTGDSRRGVELIIDGGKEVSFEECASEDGTDICVYGLFQHTPARKKYMKSERTEYGHIFELISSIALSHPEVGFKLRNDGAEIFNLPSNQSVKERVALLYGNDTAKSLIPVTYQQSNLMITGFIGKPELSRSSKKYQFLFVNGRAIESRVVSQAVKEGFHSLLMHEKYPWYLFDMQIDPALVDVNVHPRKLEVRFLNQQEIFRVIMGAVHHTLGTSAISPVFGEEKRMEFPSFERNQQTIEVKKFEPTNITQQSTFELSNTKFRPLAQIANSYIIAESEEGIVLIDQHAAHERVRYMRLMESLENESPMIQKLLLPVELELGLDSSRLVQEYLSDFQKLGFEIEAFGTNTLLLRAVPAGISAKNPEQVVSEIIADLTKEWKQNHVKNMREFLLTYTACRGAIKFGDALSMTEMQALLRDMENTEKCSHCPHGRPALVTLTYDGLETMFKRKNF